MDEALELGDYLPVPLLAIALYVVGMVIDFFAYWLVKPLKQYVRKQAWLKYGDGRILPKESSVAREIDFALYAPEIAREVAMRSSRDRIARGAIANALIAFLLEHVFSVYPPKLAMSIWIPVIILFVAMWGVFQYLSDGYEFRATLALKKKTMNEAGN